MHATYERVVTIGQSNRNSPAGTPQCNAKIPQQLATRAILFNPLPLTAFTISVYSFHLAISISDLAGLRETGRSISCPLAGPTKTRTVGVKPANHGNRNHQSSAARTTVQSRSRNSRAHTLAGPVNAGRRMHILPKETGYS